VIHVVRGVPTTILHVTPSLGIAGDTPDLLVEDDVAHSQLAGVSPVGLGPALAAAPEINRRL